MQSVRRVALLLSLVLALVLVGCSDDDGGGGASSTASGTGSASSDADGGEVPAAAEQATVVEVIDGDTIDVQLADGDQLDTVRLIGIDARERDECYYDQGAEALTELVGGQDVWLVRDTSDRDQYDRLLRYVYLDDGTFVNEQLVAQGVVEVKEYPPDTGEQDTLDEALADAQEAGEGLWADGTCGGI